MTEILVQLTNLIEDLLIKNQMIDSTSGERLLYVQRLIGELKKAEEDNTESFIEMSKKK